MGSFDELESVIERDYMFEVMMGYWGWGVGFVLVLVGGVFWMRKKGLA